MNPPFQFRAHHAHDKPLLRDGRALRALQVLIDSPTWDRLHESDDIPDVMLRELLQDDRVVMTRYGDDGPPPDVERRRMDSPWGGGEAIGWTVVTMNDDPMVPYEITETTEEWVTDWALFLDQVLVAKMVLEQERGVEDEPAALLVTVAQEVGADLLITERASLLNTRLLDSGNCQAASPADALALVALYLRAGGQFVTAKFPGWSFRAPPTQFYQQMAEAHLPSLTDFVNRSGVRVSTMRILTVLSRARTLFKSRDRIALLTSEPATGDVADEISLTFTHALVDMVAFHDVLARIINEFLEPPEQEPRRIKWQNDRWRKRVVEQFPELAAHWSGDGAAKHLNHALRVIRNEIHDVAPTIVPFKEERGAPLVGLAFQIDVGSRVMASLDALTDDRSYGIQQAFTDGHLVDPHLFYEFVLPWMLRSVNDILQALLLRVPEQPPAEPSSVLPRETRDKALRAVGRVSSSQ